MSNTGRCFDYVINMIENSTFEDRELLAKFSAEDPHHHKSFYYMVRQAASFSEHTNTSIDHERAYQILIDAVSDYILSYSTSYSAKRKLYNRMLALCKHIGAHYHIDEYETYLTELPEQIATDIAVEIVKDLHDQNGISKEELSDRYGVSEKTIQVCLHRIADQRCSDPIRIGGQAVFVPITHSESNRKLGKRKYFTTNTMSPLVYQMNIMQVETLMKSFQLNYDSGNNIPLDLAIDTWSQLSEYARQRIREIFAERDPDLAGFLDLVEEEMNSDEYRFMTESEMMERKDVSRSEQLDIAYKGSMLCNLSLTGPHRTKKNQRIKFDHGRQCFYAVPADNLGADPLYFTVDEVYEIEEV